MKKTKTTKIILKLPKTFSNLGQKSYNYIIMVRMTKGMQRIFAKTLQPAIKSSSKTKCLLNSFENEKLF